VGGGTHHATGRRPLTDSTARSAWLMPRCRHTHKGAQTAVRRARQRPAVAGEHYTSHAHHATASWLLGMAVLRRAHWLKLQSIEPGKAVMCRCHQAQRLAASHDRAGGGDRNAGTPKDRRSLTPSRKLIKHLRSTIYMPNRPLANVERAQAAIKSVAMQSRLKTQGRWGL
jgi:hypothetical protein